MLDHRNVAYLILAHADLAHLRRLVAALPPDSIKLVHLDKKCAEKLPVQDLPNTVAAENAIAVYWADFSIVEATLRLLEAALQLPQVERIVLLSGSCYPIKSDRDILVFLAAHADDNFIKMFEIESASSLYHDKLSRAHIGESAVARVFRSDMPRVNYLLSRGLSRVASLRTIDWRGRLAPFKPYYGSQWWAVTRACGEYMLAQARTCAQLQYLERCFAPDEMYFHTIVGNSPFVTERNIIAFAGRGNWRLANLHLISDRSLRYVYSHDDLAAVLASGKLFVRKVNTERSAALLDALDENRGKAIKVLRFKLAQPSVPGSHWRRRPH
jgi:hypothetical protein